MYNVMSAKAEEFIDDKEIRECLEYANQHKKDAKIIDDILAKARKILSMN